MRPHSLPILLGLLAVGAIGAVPIEHVLAAPDAPKAGPNPSDFDRAMAASMTRMHGAMAVPPSGDPDRDFAAMMIPHHQGAIDMAKVELAHGRDPVLRRLAQGILVEQAQEIDVMHRALADLPPPPATTGAAPAGPSAHHHHDEPTPGGRQP